MGDGNAKHAQSWLTHVPLVCCSMLRQHGAVPAKTNGTQPNGSSDAVSLPVAPESAALATGVVVEQVRGQVPHE